MDHLDHVHHAPSLPDLPATKEKAAGSLFGRVFVSLAYCRRALLRLALRIINAIFSLFCSYRIALPQLPPLSQLQIPSLSPDRNEPNNIPTESPPEIHPQATEEQEIDQHPVVHQQLVVEQTHPQESKVVKTLEPPQEPIVHQQPLVVPLPASPRPVAQTIVPIETSEDDHSSQEDKKAWAYLAKNSIESEKDQATVDQMLQWILAHAEHSEPATKQLMKQFITAFAKRSETEEMQDEGAYIRWIEGLDPKQLEVYAQLLQHEGSPPPLFYHLKKELQAAALAGQSTVVQVGERIKVIFSTFGALHAEAVTDLIDFWNLIYLFPTQAAASLNADALAILAKNKKRHEDLKILVPRLPEDDDLVDKLHAITPHTSVRIEMAVSLKVQRLSHVNSARKPLTSDQKKTLKRELSQKMIKGLENDRLETQSRPATPKSEDVKKFKWNSQRKDPPSPQQKDDVEKAEAIPKTQWPNDQCLAFLKEKNYALRDDQESENIVFDWILNQEALYKDVSCRNDIDAFIAFILTKPLYIETTVERLRQMSNDQFRFFVKLLGKERIELLWTLEAKFVVALSEETQKIARLKTALNALSEEQLQISLHFEKFFELLRSYPKELGSVLTTSQWGVIAGYQEREEDLFLTLTRLVTKAELDADPQFPDKLHAVCHLVKNDPLVQEKKEHKIALKHAIEKKLLLCPSDLRKKISSRLKANGQTPSKTY